MSEQEIKQLQDRLDKLRKIKVQDLSVRIQIHSIEELLKMNKK